MPLTYMRPPTHITPTDLLPQRPPCLLILILVLIVVAIADVRVSDCYCYCLLPKEFNWLKEINVNNNSNPGQCAALLLLRDDLSPTHRIYLPVCYSLLSDLLPMYIHKAFVSFAVIINSFHLRLVVFIMHSSYHIFLPSQAYLDPLPESRGRSSNLLTSIKSLVQGSLSRSRSPRGLQASNDGRTEREISQTIHDRRQVHPSSHKHLKPHVCPRRRPQAPIISVADYLTLAQLENVWREQDRRRGDAEIARGPQQQKPEPSATEALRPNPSSNIHPAFRSRRTSLSEDRDGPASWWKDP